MPTKLSKRGATCRQSQAMQRVSEYFGLDHLRGYQRELQASAAEEVLGIIERPHGPSRA